MNLSQNAAIQWAVNRIAKAERSLKTLGTGQGAIVAAIKTDREKAPRIVAEATRPLAKKLGKLAAQVEADLLDRALTARADALNVELDATRKTILRRAHARYWNDAFLPAKSILDATRKRAAEVRDAAIAPLEAERKKRSATYRRAERNFETADERERAIAFERRWRKSKYDPPFDAAHEKHASAVSEARAAFHLTNHTAYALYAQRHTNLAEVLTQSADFFREQFLTLAAAEMADAPQRAKLLSNLLSSLADGGRKNPFCKMMAATCTTARDKGFTAAWVEFDKRRAEFFAQFEDDDFE